MHFQSTCSFLVLALVTATSVQLVGASQAFIHIEFNDIETADYDYFDELPLAPAAMSKKEADEVCAKDPAYGPNYEACMGGPNSAPSGCTCKPSACLQPCFGVQYTSPKNGSRGCCPLGQTFSYDEKSLEGVCCSNGTAYSYDPISKSGGCCAGAPDAKFTGSCSVPYTPCTKPFPGSDRIEGKSFIKYPNRGTWASNLNNGRAAKTFEECEAICAKDTRCVAIDWQKNIKACHPKSHGNTKVPPVQNNDVDSAISPPCLKKKDKYSDIDGTIRVYDGVAYTFKCKHVLGYGNVVPTYTTDDMLTCIKDCSNNPKCQGINYPVSGGKGNCNLKSNYEENPRADGSYVAAIPLLKRARGEARVTGATS